MLNKKFILSIVVLGVCLSVVNPCFADDFSPIKNIDVDGAQSESEKIIDLNISKENTKVINLSERDAFVDFSNASDKFVQCNVRASWNEFKDLINNSPQNDFIYMSIANKMADLGLFDLATLASSKIIDKDISKTSISAMKSFYYPKKRLKLEDELALAEIYSDILYNNQSSEATNELLKNEALLSSSDYANYLVALGYYKSGLYSNANHYINIAIIQNPNTLNYQKLKAEILAEIEDSSGAKKIVENLKKQNLNSYEYERKINSLEQYVLYKANSTEWKKNYHLGYYYYIENDSSKAIKTLQAACSSKRKTDNAIVYALMSEIYLSMNEFEKASDVANKAYKINKNLPKALITLGDLNYFNEKYDFAIKYYKQACVVDKYSYVPFVKLAKVYQKLSNNQKAIEIYTKILKTHADSWEAYYNVALMEPAKQLIYLKKALSINPLFENAWIELSRIEIEKANYQIAQKYLANAFYLDENDFRYYYYQGLVNKNLGYYNQAEYDFKKCLKLNQNYTNALNELKFSIEDRI